MKLSKIKKSYVLFVNDPAEDQGLYDSFFEILKRLSKDRLYIRAVPLREFAYYFGLNNKEFLFIVRYCTGLEYSQLISLLRSLDAFALGRRLETFGLNLLQICRISGANHQEADRLIHALAGVSLKGFLKGLKIQKQIPFKEEKRKGISALRNQQQKRNTEFLKQIEKAYKDSLGK